MVQWENIKRVTVTEQIMEQIAQFITQGQLKAGDKLPNERDLAARLGVTRGRVREALRALSLIGLITIKAGEGSYVNTQEMPIPEDTIVWMFHNEINNLEEVYAARKLIESEVFTSAAGKLTPSQLREMESILLIIKNLSQPEPAIVLQQLDKFDLFLGECCGNAIFFKLMQTIIHLRRETSLKILHVPGAIKNSIQSRFIILNALQTGDSKKVKFATLEFFERSKSFYKSLAKEITDTNRACSKSP